MKTGTNKTFSFLNNLKKLKIYNYFDYLRT